MCHKVVILSFILYPLWFLSSNGSILAAREWKRFQNIRFFGSDYEIFKSQWHEAIDVNNKPEIGPVDHDFDKRYTACRRCSNWIFIIDLTPGFNGLGKDNYKTRREPFKFGDLVRLISEIYSIRKRFNVFCIVSFAASFLLNRHVFNCSPTAYTKRPHLG